MTKTGENIELLNLKLLQCEIKAAVSAWSTALKIPTCFEIEQISAADKNLDDIQQKIAELRQMYPVRLITKNIGKESSRDQNANTPH